MQFTTLALAVLSIGSVFGAPTVVARSDPKILTSAISAASGSKTAVDTQVAIIKNLVQTTVNSAAIPAIRASLRNIAAEIASVTTFVVPLVIDVALPLAQQELDNLPGFVGNAKGIAADVESTANLILAGLSQQSLLLVKTEALLVLATVSPFVQPITVFANSAIVGTSGPSTEIVGTTIATTQDIAGRIQGPITAAFVKVV
ncbi:hypothetical protein NUW58_g66 [Xylaria curta]|uniref:Uncharacterized protein n=1 Tax=Xylaria curta TaxID=42375 RepID=A0ACC1PQK7_9PEZI|nr:hypothetical protein NUW58_g66 [Xylaria curta]